MLKKVDIADVQLGMYIAELDRPWLESPFLFQGFLLTDEEDLEKLRGVCRFVYVDPGKGDGSAGQAKERRSRKDVSEVASRAEAQGSKAPPYERSFEEEIPPARDIHRHTKEYMEELFHDIRTGKSIKAGEARELVMDMVDSIMRNPDALVLLSNLKDRNEYSVVHSINVSVLSLAFGRYLGFGREQLFELGMAALLHDVGEMRLPDHILQKEGMLTEEESRVMRRHTDYGKKILSETDGIPQIAIDVAHSHHERMNGSGYPRGLRGDDIGYFSRIVGIVDVYDAVTSNHVYRTRITSTEALKSMYDWREQLFDAEIVEQFIQCLGIYPIGSVVELNTGEVGIVISVALEQRLYPKLMLVRTSEKKAYFPPRILNLAQYTGDDLQAPYEIKKVLDADAYGIDLKGYLLRELPLEKQVRSQSSG